MQAVRGLLRSRWGVVRRMNHQAGPEANGADANSVDSMSDTGAAAADAAEDEAGRAARLEGQTEADGTGGEAADHEVAIAAAEPVRPETGEPRVDAALTLLDRLTELPVTDHAAVLELVHAELTAVLGQLDPESAGADD